MPMPMPTPLGLAAAFVLLLALAIVVWRVLPPIDAEGDRFPGASEGQQREEG